MSGLATTRLSSRGQIVIPEKIRTALRLEPGAQFVVLADADVVILKRIDAPPRSDIRAFGAPPLDPIWHASTGIALLGPRHFGFDLDHMPLQFAERPAA